MSRFSVKNYLHFSLFSLVFIWLQSSDDLYNASFICATLLINLGWFENPFWSLNSPVHNHCNSMRGENQLNIVEICSVFHSKREILSGSERNGPAVPLSTAERRHRHYSKMSLKVSKVGGNPNRFVFVFALAWTDRDNMMLHIITWFLWRVAFLFFNQNRLSRATGVNY